MPIPSLISGALCHAPLLTRAANWITKGTIQFEEMD